MNKLIKIFSFSFFCFPIFDCLASAEDDLIQPTDPQSSILRTDTEIAHFLGLQNLSYNRKAVTPDNQVVLYTIPLVTVNGSSLDRTHELKKCTYLTGEELSADWHKFEGNRDWLNESRYVVADTEVNKTTYEGEIVEICLLEFINGKATGLEFSTFIRPHSKTFSQYSQKVHGITYSKLLNMPFFSDIAEPLKTFIGDSLVIAHNAAFDIRMLAQEYERLSTTNIFKFYYKCTLQMHRRDEWRARNPTKTKGSPLKKKTVQYITKEERNEIAREKRAFAAAKKKRSRRSLFNSGSNKENISNKKQKTTRVSKPSAGGLGSFIESRVLTTQNVPTILGIETDLTGQHHNARFDTYVGAVKVEEFNQKAIEKDIRSSQESGGEFNDEVQRLLG